MEFSISFRPLGEASAKPNAVAWIQTSGVDDVSYSWNADIKVYRILSTAEDVTVEAYLIKNQLRTMSSAVAGDYFATGNTLMRDAQNDPVHIRETWLNYDHSSDATVVASDIGESEANPTEISAAYLYCTAWKDTESMTTLFSETAPT